MTRNPREIDTAIHEIGHTIGFPHEHQNPFAGIVWDEEAVYAALAQPPNSWDRAKTFHNILSKINPDTVQGSSCIPNRSCTIPSVKSLICEPVQYRAGLTPAGGLSARDRTGLSRCHPLPGEVEDPELRPGESVKLAIAPGQQRNFRIQPDATRYYNIQTFGVSGLVVVLFEDVNGQLRYLSGDDDSGEDRNASLRVRLRKGREYVLRVRLFYADRSGETAVMLS